MRIAVPLYEFMPYGAPELLESRHRHLSRALILTSGLALALYSLTGGVASLFPHAALRPSRQIVVEPRVWDFVTPEKPQPRPRAEIAPRRAIDKPAVPVVIKDELEIPPIEPERMGADEGESRPNAPPVVGKISTGESVREVLPARGEWVYVEELPAPIREVKPGYPEIARQAGVEGTVQVHVLVGTDGRVRDAVLSKTIQVPMLNDVALAAARQWVFTPGLANGKPVACWTAIPFWFRLY